MSGWNHRIRPLEDGEGWRECSGPLCKAAPTHIAEYECVTGRGGRVATRTKLWCDAHAVGFAERFSLNLGAVVSPSGEDG